MKKNLLLPLVALSIISCSSDELQQQETSLRQKGTQEIVFDEIAHGKKAQSRAADIEINNLLPDDAYMGVMYYRDDNKALYYNNQKYEIKTTTDGTQKFNQIETGQGIASYPLNSSIGLNAVAYIPYMEEKDDKLILTIGPTLDSDYFENIPDIDPFWTLIDYSDQLTKEDYQKHDLMIATLNHMKATDASHRLDFIHVNYRMQLTVDLTEVGVRNLSLLKDATLSLLGNRGCPSQLAGSIVFGEESPYSCSFVEDSQYSYYLDRTRVLGKILEFGTPTSTSDKLVTTFCIPPHTLKAGAKLFRLTFNDGTYMDITINPTKDKTLESNLWTKYTLKLRPSEIVLGAKMNNWKASVIVTGSSEDAPADVFME